MRYSCGETGHVHETEVTAFACIKHRREIRHYGMSSEVTSAQARPPRPSRQSPAPLACASPKGLCQWCGGQRRLELHHHTYDFVGCELPCDLLALSRDCHLAEHVDLNGDF